MFRFLSIVVSKLTRRARQSVWIVVVIFHQSKQTASLTCAVFACTCSW